MPDEMIQPSFYGNPYTECTHSLNQANKMEFVNGINHCGTYFRCRCRDIDVIIRHISPTPVVFALPRLYVCVLVPNPVPQSCACTRNRLCSLLQYRAYRCHRTGVRLDGTTKWPCDFFRIAFIGVIAPGMRWKSRTKRFVAVPHRCRCYGLHRWHGTGARSFSFILILVVTIAPRCHNAQVGCCSKTVSTWQAR